MRTPTRGTFKSQFLLPAGLLVVAVMASFAMFIPGADAGASGRADATQVSTSATHVTTRACGTINLKGVTNSTRNAGNPFNSSNRFCLNGHLISYGSRAITYANPPQSFISAGQLLFAQTCSSCHGNDANGVNPDGTATIGPNLQGVGAATVDFWVSTGRMPATDVKAVEAERKASRLTAAPGAGAGRLGQLARPLRPGRALPPPGDGGPVGGPGPLLPQLRGLPHD